MKKRVLSVVLSVLMLLSIVPLTALADSATTTPNYTYTFEANKTEVNPGDEITITGYVSASITTYGFQYDLDIPAGLTYVANSGKIDPDVGTTMNCQGDCSYTEVSKRVLVGSYLVLENLDQKLKLVTFKCKVNDDAAAGDYEIGAKAIYIIDENMNEQEDGYQLNKAKVSVVIPTTGITLDKTSATLTKADSTVQLTATVAPANASNKTVTWTSSNTSVATVDATGLVTRVGEGSTVITAKASGGQEATCAITVSHECEAATLTPIAAKDSTCIEQGNNAYFVCSCGKYYKDSAATTETTVEAEKKDLASHNPTKTDAKAPDCENAGNIDYWTCGTCQKIFSDAACRTEISLEDTVVAANGHNPTKTDAVAATCTEAGNIDYWTCGDCQKIFSDAACTQVITSADTVVAAKGHKPVKTDAKAATCTVDGNIAYWTCGDCQKIFSDAECKTEITLADTVIAALKHDYVTNVTAPTCTAQGYTTHKCSRCSDNYVDTYVPAKGHDFPAKEDWVESETEKGVYYGYCKNGCGEYQSETRTIFVDGVSLDQNNVETKYVRKAPAFTLTAIISPEAADEEYTVVWSSSNEEVATVDQDGNVTTHKRGTAEITVTVTSADGTQTFTDTCNVKVKYSFWQWLIWFFLVGCLWYFV